VDIVILYSDDRSREPNSAVSLRVDHDLLSKLEIRERTDWIKRCPVLSRRLQGRIVEQYGQEEDTSLNELVSQVEQPVLRGKAYARLGACRGVDARGLGAVTEGRGPYNKGVTPNSRSLMYEQWTRGTVLEGILT
jgi:hypothetical protein